MSPAFVIGVSIFNLSLLAALAAAYAWRTGRLGPSRLALRTESAETLRELAEHSAQAGAEIEAAVAGIRSASAESAEHGEAPNVVAWLGRLVGSGRNYAARLDVAHARLARFAAAERGLKSTVHEIACQRDRVEALCRTAEAAGGADPARVAAAVSAASEVVTHERKLRVELDNAAERLASRAARFAGAQRDPSSDPLTGLPNRRGFEARLADRHARAEASGDRYAVAILDIDHLAALNERHGHAAGDAALALAGRLLRSSARPCDDVARLGGGEFALLLPGADSASAAAVAESCRRAVTSAVVQVGREKVSFTLSGGTASWFAGRTAEDVLATAREAAAEAKAAGRNRVVAVGRVHQALKEAQPALAAAAH